MIKVMYKVGTAVASGAMLLSSLVPAVSAATTVTISGNGSFSSNSASLDQTTNTTVRQTNNANVTNDVRTDLNTGNNTSFGNTGSGGSSISTGDATANTSITNALNSNAAVVSPCGGCADGATNVKISDNGSVSDNSVDLTKTKNTTVTQTNDANIDNTVDAHLNTGGNDVTNQTGGSSQIRTGSASDTTNIVNRANRNVAVVGGGAGTGAGNAMNFEISDNGAFASDTIDASLTNNTVLAQTNVADISNEVDARLKTGNNHMFGNTGNGVDHISTGNAVANTSILNDVNVNAASVNPCCNGGAGDIGVKIAGNGFDSVNPVTLDLDNNLVAAQGNNFSCGGSSVEQFLFNFGGNCADVNAHGNTGTNAVDFSTTGISGDPSVNTGSTAANTGIVNSGNVNLYGTSTLPTGSLLPFPSSSTWNLWWASMSSSMGL